LVEIFPAGRGICQPNSWSVIVTVMSRDPEATKARIFAAASAEFAAYGISGARVDRIARNAQANKQLIYAYFGDKHELFGHVLERVLVNLADTVAFEMDDIDRWVDRHIDYHRAHPEMLRLMLWEALEYADGEVPLEDFRRARYLAKVASFEEAQRRGVLRSDLPAPHLLYLLLSLINWPAVTPQAGRMLLGRHPQDEPGLRASVHVAARSLAGPQPEAEGGAAAADGGRSELERTASERIASGRTLGTESRASH
jgi:AcrR family transcriptional regulator